MGTVQLMFFTCLLTWRASPVFGLGSQPGESPRQGPQVLQPFVGNRLKMLFPLLIRISARLATIIPIMLATLGSLFAMVLFAKKAFILSLVAVTFTVLDKYRTKSSSTKVKHIIVRPPPEHHWPLEDHGEPAYHEAPYSRATNPQVAHKSLLHNGAHRQKINEYDKQRYQLYREPPRHDGSNFQPHHHLPTWIRRWES